MKKIPFWCMLLFVATIIFSCQKEEELTKETLEKKSASSNASGGDGIIYAINQNNRLLWYRHDGRYDGSASWANNGNARVVGRGWNFKHVFYGGNDIIYAITHNNRLLWFRHDGRFSGTNNWAGNGRVVGTGWNFKHVFSGGDGVIYAINDDNQLLWY